MTHQVPHYRKNRRGKRFIAGRKIVGFEKKLYLDALDKHILGKMVQEERFMTTAEIAEAAGISWNTAQDRLSRMHRKGLINQIGRGSREYWRAQGRI
jgi:predicted transcriptional regulator